MTAFISASLPTGSFHGFRGQPRKEEIPGSISTGSFHGFRGQFRKEENSCAVSVPRKPEDTRVIKLQRRNDRLVAVICNGTQSLSPISDPRTLEDNVRNLASTSRTLSRTLMKKYTSFDSTATQSTTDYVDIFSNEDEDSESYGDGSDEFNSSSSVSELLQMARPCTSTKPVARQEGTHPSSATTKLLSKGSAGHSSGECKPCSFYHTTGCENGEDCLFCHLCTRRKVMRKFKNILKKHRRNMRTGDENNVVKMI